MENKLSRTIRTLTLLAGLTAAHNQAALFDFSVSDQGWTPAVESGASLNPFIWTSSGGIGGNGAWMVGAEVAQSIKSLTSPVLTVGDDGTVSFTLTHRYNFEYDIGFDDAFDGGQLRYRVNGGAWTVVPSGQFTENGYVSDVDGVDGLGFLQPGWSSTSSGYSTPAYITSSGTIGSLNAGDELEVQFRAGWNLGIAAPSPNWEIAQIDFTNASPVPEPAGAALAGGLALLSFALARRFLP